MTQYAALDVSQEMTAVCLVDEAGQVIGEAKLLRIPIDPAGHSDLKPVTVRT